MYYKKIYIDSCRLLLCDYTSAVDLILDGINNNRQFIFSHINLYNYYLISKYNLLNLNLSDQTQNYFEGIGLKIISFLLGKGWNKDVNGTDLQPGLFKKLSENNISIFMLGASSQVIEKAVANIQKTFPQLQINGYHHGYNSFDKEINIVNEINNSKTDLLIIGMGTLKEFEFINHYYELLKVKAIWNVGGLFDFLSGTKPRAPKIIRRIRMEWLFRLFLEPGKKIIRIIYVPFWFIFHFALIYD